jgi:hypothetical protein
LFTTIKVMGRSGPEWEPSYGQVIVHLSPVAETRDETAKT